MSVTKSREITEWLNGHRNYDTGCLLYNDYGHVIHSEKLYVATKQSLATYKSAPKLLRYLKQIHDELAKQPVNVAPEDGLLTSVVVAHTNNNNKILAEFDETIRLLYIDLGSRWKPKLHNATTDDERYEIQKVMVRLDDKLRDTIRQRDYYKEHGKLPEEKPKPKKKTSVKPNTAEAAMKFVNVQKYVSRYKRNLVDIQQEILNETNSDKLKALNRKADKWRLKLLNYEKELAELDQLINDEATAGE